MVVMSPLLEQNHLKESFDLQRFLVNRRGRRDSFTTGYVDLNASAATAELSHGGKLAFRPVCCLNFRRRLFNSSRRKTSSAVLIFAEWLNSCILAANSLALRSCRG